MDRSPTGPLFSDVRAVMVPSLVRVTEMAALAAARASGRGDSDRVKMAAGSAMLHELEELGFAGRVVLGPRGDHILSHGSTIGRPGDPDLDLAVYPVEGASLVAKGAAHAISMLVAVEPGAFPSLPAVWYVEKIVAGPTARGAIDLDDELADNLRRIAFARDARVSDLAVAILDRPRHQDLVQQVRDSGRASSCSRRGGGGRPDGRGGGHRDRRHGRHRGLQETIIAACAVRCLGGEMQARLWPRNDEERLLAGDEVGRTYGIADLAPEGLDVALTGISGGPLLEAVWFGSTYAVTHSMTMSTRFATVRKLTTRHHRLIEAG